MRSLILADFALYFVWKLHPFAPYLPLILNRNAPYFALYFSILAPYWNVASMLNLEGAADAGRLRRRAPPAGYGGLVL